MPSEPGKRDISIEVVSLEANTQQSTVRVIYAVHLTTEAFEGAIGGGETTLGENHTELTKEVMGLIERIQDALHEDLGLAEAKPDTPQFEEEEL